MYIGSKYWLLILLIINYWYEPRKNPPTYQYILHIDLIFVMHSATSILHTSLVL